MKSFISYNLNWMENGPITHLNGEREYTYFVSAEKVKRTIKGNRVDVKKVLAFHVMSAKSDLPGSRIWVKIN